MERVIVGKADAIELMLVAVLCEGHVLIEDVPGIGKTMLARATARSLGFSFRRIQCTPDLLPSDITGSYIFNQRTSSFEFRAGPVFAQLILADEINRATPKTQSALLEAMQEKQVTVHNQTYKLDPPFFVLATQNPIEQEGTYPLPEAQADRFLLKIKANYPNIDDELAEHQEAQCVSIRAGLPALRRHRDDVLDDFNRQLNLIGCAIRYELDGFFSVWLFLKRFCCVHVCCVLCFVFCSFPSVGDTSLLFFAPLSMDRKLRRDRKPTS